MLRKRVSSLLMVAGATLALTSCSSRETLLFLNWGEYIDENLLTAFEEKYNCTVIMDLGDSNEIFYSKVRGGTTVYDVVCPSDYMIEKMYSKDMLQPLQYDLLPNYTAQKAERLNGVKEITETMKEHTKAYDKDGHTIEDYFAPYLWGTWGIMYNTEKEGLEAAVTTNKNQWASLFDRSSLPSGTKVAMYDSHQHAYYAACKYLNALDGSIESAHEELAQSKLDLIKDTVKNMGFNAWGTDNIKKDIVAGNIDVGFMWTGDFLYYYAENAANAVMEAYIDEVITTDEIKPMLEAITSPARQYKDLEDYKIGFDLFIPDDTIAFVDSLVITKDSSNVELAHKFINFMMSYETEGIDPETGEEITLTPAYDNTYYVCYNAPYGNIFDDLVALKDEEYTEDDKVVYDEAVANGDDLYDSDLYWKIYDSATGIAFNNYYRRDEVIGDILASFDRHYVTKINTTFNNART